MTYNPSNAGLLRMFPLGTDADLAASWYNHTPYYSVNVDMQIANKQKIQGLRLHLEAALEKSINKANSILQNQNQFSTNWQLDPIQQMEKRNLRMSLEQKPNT